MQSDARSTDDLARCCEDEQHRFESHQPSDPQHCYELFMRAAQETEPDAFTHIHRIFRNMVLRWIRNDPRSLSAEDTPDGLANWAFARLYFEMRKPSFLLRSNSLGGILEWFRMITWSVITEDLRKARRRKSEVIWPDDADFPDDKAIEDDLVASRFWECVRAALPDRKQQMLAYLFIVLEMSPAEIEAKYSEWKAVRQSIYLVRSRLRKDRLFLECLGVEVPA